jgi:putative tryptophan/tyrosine transport system substrate-binding protein
MDRRRFLLTSLAGAVAVPLAVEAQQTGKVYRIGYITIGAPSPSGPATFVQGLGDRGYVEGRNLVIERRYMEGPEQERAVGFVAEFLRLQVDAIVTPSTVAALAAKRATSTVPIVTVGVANPERTGLVASLARPGGNVTGIARAEDDPGKQLQLLKEAIPRLRRVAFLWNPDNRASADHWEKAQVVAPSLGLALVSIEVRGPGDLEPSFTRILREGAEGLFAQDAMSPYRMRLVEWVGKNRLPLVAPSSIWVIPGVLRVYGPSYDDMFRRAAAYVDKVLRGTSPAELPVEQPHYHMVINLKTAKALGLTIPPSLLGRADQVIE